MFAGSIPVRTVKPKVGSVLSKDRIIKALSSFQQSSMKCFMKCVEEQTDLGRGGNKMGH